MNLKKHLRSVTCLGLPAVGFALICVGAYLMSLQNEDSYDTLGVILAYVQIVCGFLAMLIGVFWAICHGMKSKLYQRDGHHQIQIYSINRPFPPSYEDSQRSHVDPDGATIEEGIPTAAPAPPLYNEHSSDVPNCAWSWERPPPYTPPPPTLPLRTHEDLPPHTHTQTPQV